MSKAREPNEPTLTLDPKNPLRMVAGANQDNVYLSVDGGRTWGEDFLSSPFNVRGDPCVIADTTGAFYYFHMSDSMAGQGYWLDRIVCQRLDSGTSAWTSGTGIGLNPPRANQDKEWAVADPVTNALYVTWTQFDRYRGTDPQDSSNILFSKSTDRGETWSAPVRLNESAGGVEDGDNTVEGANPAPGPNGEIYVSWAGPAGLRFDRSLDNGQSWMPSDILVDSMPGGWDFTIPGLFRSNGFPITAADIGSGPFRGTLYVCWSDQSNDSTDTDVWLKKSSDGGLTWGARKRVNDDPPGRHQFFPWMTLDQSTGYLWFVFYDRRNHSDNTTDVYMACSRDGGETFVNFRVSQAPFTPQPGFFLGDYLNVSAAMGIVRPIWIRMDSVPGWWERSVWTALVDTGRIGENAASIRYTVAPRKKITARRIISVPGFAPSFPYYDVLGRWQAGSPNRARKNMGRSPPDMLRGAEPKGSGKWMPGLVLLLFLAGSMALLLRRRS